MIIYVAKVFCYSHADNLKGSTHVVQEGHPITVWIVSDAHRFPVLFEMFSDYQT